MPIVNNPEANYTPPMKGYSGQGAFRFWCQTVLPLVYDDSLSYYELLNKIVVYLNNTISDVANMEDNVDALHTAYVQLQNYVNNYFTNLDVQAEINNKLDEMATDGTLTELFTPYIVTTVGEWLTEHLTPTTPAIDNTLSINNAAANAKTVGDRAMLNGGAYNTAESFQDAFDGDYNNLPANRIITIGSASVGGSHAPDTDFYGVVITMSHGIAVSPGDCQIAISSNNGFYHRYYGVSNNEPTWSDWVRLATRTYCDNTIDEKTITHYGTQISTAERASAITNGSLDVNDFPVNKIILVATNPSNLGLTNYAWVNGGGTGVYLCYNHNNTNGNGYTQLFIGRYGIASRIKISNSWTPWIAYSVPDTTLSESGRSADAKTVGDRALLNGGAYNTAQEFIDACGGDYDNLPLNRIVCIGSVSVGGSHAPDENFYGCVITFGHGITLSEGDYQLAISSNNALYHRYYGVGGWSDWIRDASRSYVDNSIIENAVTHYGTQISTAERANEITGGSMSVDNFPANKIILVSLNPANIGLSNYAWVNGGGTGLYFTYNYNNTSNNGYTQMFVGRYGIATRVKINNAWTPWNSFDYQEDVYYVGANRDNTSVTELFKNLKNDTRKKIIYVDPGVYDIFKEYRDLNMPSPPDDIGNSDYIPWIVWVPDNTKLIGIGNVVFKWNPDETVAGDNTVSPITYGEARTWSPLNVLRQCYIENIEVQCYKGRYCIHDDSKNNAADQNVTHEYKNVRCYYKYVTEGYGFNDVVGFGFSEKNKYIFENCVFELTDGVRYAFYGHGVSGNANADNSPNIIANNCIFICGNQDTGAGIRLQNISTSQLKINASFNGCYIYGNVLLDAYSTSAVQSFDVTLLKSGNPTVTYNGTIPNIYSPKIYN